ncbi:CapA family protein [Alicyclobacillus ferrooxydans]|uniref:Capsule synthesis protein CapA domain-containing protein n=1 Tax=Alicyclobacillus ferrooxydans TaxID=471514 RepID=A0A0P9EQ26_9BACL|nr:CapA family protein [Alicyclobacillus ferrooxydans]KPV45636.1 hypothetical protein AN477_01600 [Alicyclobacillus ferrooxydans]
MKQPVLIMAIGDTFIDRDLEDSPFSEVEGILRSGDFTIANNEGVYCDTTEPVPNASFPLISSTGMVKLLDNTGIEVVSLANNHALDGGYTGLRSTLEALASIGIKTIGAGQNLEKARCPVEVSRKGNTFGILSFTAVFPQGYEARQGLPGVSPLRTYDFYAHPDAKSWSPGIIPQVITLMDEHDSQQISESIMKLKQNVDYVIVCAHWGDSTKPSVITDFERNAAHMCIDSGADIVIGHHHHSLRGIEFHDGKPILYGLGNFLMDVPNVSNRLKMQTEIDDTTISSISEQIGDFGIWERQGYPTYPYPPECRYTAVFLLEVSDLGIRVGIAPCIIGNDGKPRASKNDSNKDVVDYFLSCTKQANLPQLKLERSALEGFDILWIFGR